MTYADRSFVRDKVLKVRTNVHSKRLVEAVAGYIGRQTADWAHDVIVEAAERVAHEMAKSAADGQKLRRSK